MHMRRGCCGGLTGRALFAAVVTLFLARGLGGLALAPAIIAALTLGTFTRFGQGESFGQGAARDLLLDQIFNAGQIFVVKGRRDGKRFALAPCAPGAADPVDVILGVAGQVKVEHVRNIVDIEIVEGRAGWHILCALEDLTRGALIEKITDEPQNLQAQIAALLAGSHCSQALDQKP